MRRELISQMVRWGSIYLVFLALLLPVQVFAEPEAKLVETFYGVQSEFTGVSGMAVGQDGRIYLAEADLNKIVILRPDGSFYKTIAENDVVYPSQLALDNNDNIYVVSDYKEIRVYDKEGTFLRKIGREHYSWIVSFAIANNKLYIFDYSMTLGFGRFSIFDLQGLFLREITRPPWEAYVDMVIADGKIFASGYSHVVVVFNESDGSIAYEFPVAGYIERDSREYFYVTVDGKIDIYTKEGNFVKNLLPVADYYPMVISLDEYLYTYDFYSNTINKYLLYPESLPAPKNLGASAQSGGRVVLFWEAPAGEAPASYNVYRAETADIDPKTLSPLAQNISLTGYVDQTPADQTYYYAVTALDGLGNESVVSNISSATSDSLGPAATISMSGSSPYTIGEVQVTVNLNESVLEPPKFSWTATDGTEKEVVLQGAAMTWSGVVTIEKETPNGTAYFAYEGKDALGNISNAASGAVEFKADTLGPVASVSVDKNSPVNSGELAIILSTDEEVADVPILRLVFADEQGQILPLSKDGMMWKAVYTITQETANGAAYFEFEAKDSLGNVGQEITVDKELVIDTLAPASPLQFTGSAQPSGDIELYWRAPPAEQVQGYSLYRSTQAITIPDENLRIAFNHNGLFFKDHPSIEGTYYYAITALDVAGNESSSAACGPLTSDTTAPEPVQNITVSLDNNKNIVVEWTQGAGETPSKYTIYRSTEKVLQPDTSLIVKSNHTALSFADQVAAEGTYFYAVTAVDDVGNESVLSAGVSILWDFTAPSAEVTLVPVSPVRAGIAYVSVKVSEFLPSAPRQWYAPLGQPAQEIFLTGKGADWSGQISISGQTQNGPALFSFEGIDSGNNIGTTINSGGSFIIDTIAPPVVADVSAKAMGQGYIELSWKNGVGELAHEYSVYRSTNPAGDISEMEKVGSNTNTTFIDRPDLESTYYYAVRSVDLAGNKSGLSSIVSLTNDNTPPSPVSSLTALSQNGSVVLTWNAGSPEEGVTFNLYRSPAPITNVENVTPISTGFSTVSYQDIPTLEGTVYYAVTSVDHYGNENNQFAAASVFYDKNAPTATIALEKASPVKAGTLRTTLQISESVQGNPVLFWKMRSGGTNPITLNQIGNSWQGEIVIPSDYNGEAIFLFEAMDISGNTGSEIKTGKSFIIDNQPPGASAYFQAEPATGGKVELRWLPPPGETSCSYNLYRSIVDVETLSDLTPIAAGLQETSYADQPGADGVYYYYLLAADAAGNVSSSFRKASIYSDSMKPMPPENLTAIINADKTILLSWKNPSAGETPAAYTVYRSKTPDFSPAQTTPAITAVTGLSVTDTILENGKYYYKVCGLDAANNMSDPSNEVSIELDVESPTACLTTENAYFGAGSHPITLAASEDLAKTPEVELVFANGRKQKIEMSGGGKNWSGDAVIDKQSSNGEAIFSFKGEDYAGNIGTVILAGTSSSIDSVVIDTIPPVLENFVIKTAAQGRILLEGSFSEKNTLSSYLIYRSETLLPDITGLVPLAITKGSAYEDIPANDGQYYYTMTAEDSAGNRSSFVEWLSIISDRLLPAAPVLSSVVQQNKGVKLCWTAAADAQWYELYRAPSVITALAQAKKIGAYFSTEAFDLPAESGTYYYVVVSRDPSGNVSALSNCEQVEFVQYFPVASISINPPSPVSTGITVTLAANKSLAQAPKLVCHFPEGSFKSVNEYAVRSFLANPVVTLHQEGEAWVGSLDVPKDVLDGAAIFEFEGRDTQGFVGTAIAGGGSFVIDRGGPACTITIHPFSPVHAGSVHINLAASETLIKAPLLTFTPMGGLPIPVTLQGSGSSWQGVMSITPEMKNGYAYFSFAGIDQLNNVGTRIESGEQFLIDNQLPSPPLELKAEGKKRGEIALTWSPSANGSIQGYTLYRSVAPIQTKLPEQHLFTNQPLLAYTDIPSADGIYYYAVTSIDNDGQESELSASVSAVSDRTAPGMPREAQATQSGEEIKLTWLSPIGDKPAVYRVYRDTALLSETALLAYTDNQVVNKTYSYQISSVDSRGNESFLTVPQSVAYVSQLPVAKIAADKSSPWTTGTVNVTLTTSEEMLGVPELFWAPSQSSPQPVPVNGSGSLWTGQLTIEENMSNGEGMFTFRGTGKSGLTGTVILEGKVVSVDTKGPKATIIVAAGTAVPAGETTVSVQVSEELPAAPYLDFVPQGKEKILVPLAGSGKLWTGVLQVSSATGDGTALFHYKGIDGAGNAGEFVESGKVFTIDTVAPGAPIDVQAVPTRFRGGVSGIEISWLAPNAGAGDTYHIYRTRELLQSVYGLTPVGMSNELVYTDIPPSDSPYYYSVAAVDKAGNYSNVASIFTPAQTDRVQPFPPINLKAAQLANGALHFTWQKPEGEEPFYYNLYISEKGDAQGRLNSLNEGIIWTEIYGTPKENGSYGFVVTAVDKAGNESSPSNKVVFDYTYINSAVKAKLTLDGNIAIGTDENQTLLLREGKYFVKLEVNEPLTQPPELSIVPQGKDTIFIALSGQGLLWHGEFVIDKNFGDGLAVLKWKGIDIEGLESTIIEPNGTFKDFVVVDTISPGIPQEVVAVPFAETMSGGIKVTWKPPLVEFIHTYYVYRSAQQFSQTSEGVLVSAINVPALMTEYEFVDIPPQDGTFYYAVMGGDRAGNRGNVSGSVSALSTHSVPVATLYLRDQYSGGMQAETVGEGELSIDLVSAKPLPQAPVLKCKPQGKEAIEISLSGSGTSWQGSMIITKDTGDGLAEFSYAGTDEHGVTSDKIAYGKTVAIDTKRARAAIIIPAIYKQVPNVDENKLVTKPLREGSYQVIIKTTEPLFDVPQLSYELPHQTILPVSLSGFGDTWEGTMSITKEMPNGECIFHFQGYDRQRTMTTEIAGVEYTYDTTPEHDNSIFERYLGERIVATYASTGGKFVIDTVPPAPPANIASRILKLGAVEIYWEQAENGCSYEVFRNLKEITSVAGLARIHEQDLQAKFYVDMTDVDGTFFYAARSIDVAGNVSELSATTSLFVDSIKPEIKFKAVPLAEDIIVVEGISSNKSYFTPPKNITLVLTFPGENDSEGNPKKITVNCDALKVYNPLTQKEEYKYVTYLPQKLSYYNGEVNIRIYTPDLKSGEIVESETGLSVSNVPVATGGVVSSADRKAQIIIPAGVKPVIPAGPGQTQTYDKPKYLYYFTNEYAGEEVVVDEGTTKPETIDMSKYHPGILMVGVSYDFSINVAPGEPDIMYTGGVDLSKITLAGVPLLEMGVDADALENLLGRGYGAGSETLNPKEKYKIVGQKLKVYLYVEPEKNDQGEVTQPGRWEVLKDSFFDPEKQVMVAMPARVGKFAVFAEADPPKISQMKPEQEQATKDFQPEIQAHLEDMGVGIDADTIVLKIDGQVVEHSYASQEYFRGDVSYEPVELLLPGTHTVTLYVEDVVENKQEFRWQFIVDNEPPQATTFVPARDSIVGFNKPVISCLLSDIGGGLDSDSVELHIDSGTVTGNYDERSGRFVYVPAAALADGLHEVTLKGKDTVEEQITVAWTFTVDTKGPTAQQYYPADETFYNCAVPPYVLLEDELSGVSGEGLQMMLDGVAISSTLDDAGKLISTEIKEWTEGTHEIAVICQDKTGNATELRWSFTVDTIAPTVQSLVSTEGISLSIESPLVLFEVSDEGSGINGTEIKMQCNGEAVKFIYEGDTGELLYQPETAIPDGNLEFVLTVVDNAGNSSTTVLNTGIDTTPPVISEISPFNGEFLNFAAPDLGALVQDLGVGIDEKSIILTIDGQANGITFAQSTNKVKIATNNSYAVRRVKGVQKSGWSEGWHTIELTVKDLNGNQAAAHWSFLIDTVPPVISGFKVQEGFVSGDYVSSRPYLRFDLFDETSGVDVEKVTVSINSESKKCKVNEVTIPNWKGAYQPEEKLSAGTYTANVEAFDRAANKTVSQEIVFVISNEIDAEKVISYPNPFKDSVKFTYILPQDMDEVRIEVYDLSGELIYETNEALRLAGYNETFWNGKNCYGEDTANGVYFYRLIIRGDGQEKVIVKKSARLR